MVGMTYHGISSGDAVRHLAGHPTLQREPHNSHDSNAVAIWSKGKMLGYINQEAAAIIAPLLDEGASSRVSHDTSRTKSARSIPVTVKIDRPLENIGVPTVCEPGVIGIYRISVRGYDRCYIGQSADVQHRLAEHWDELRRGIHQNPELRQLWRSHGATAFEATLLERAPESLGGLALARWLVERERAFIQEFGGLRNTINAKWPKIVLGDSDKAELQKERQKFAQELEVLQKKLDDLSQKLSEQRDRAELLLRWANEATGFWSIFASATTKRNADLAKTELPSLKEEVSTLESERRAVKGTLDALKRLLLLS